VDKQTQEFLAAKQENSSPAPGRRLFCKRNDLASSALARPGKPGIFFEKVLALHRETYMISRVNHWNRNSHPCRAMQSTALIPALARRGLINPQPSLHRQL